MHIFVATWGATIGATMTF